MFFISQEQLICFFLVAVCSLSNFVSVLLSCCVLYILRCRYIPLTNRVRGPYCKLRTLFSPHRFIWPKRKRAGHKSKENNEDPLLTVRTEKTRLVRYLSYLYCLSDGFGKNTSLNFTGRTAEYGPLNWPIAALAVSEKYDKSVLLKTSRENINICSLTDMIAAIDTKMFSNRCDNMETTFQRHCAASAEESQ